MVRDASSKVVAAALGVKPTTIQRYAREARIPFDETPGGHRRFNVEEVRAMLAPPAKFVAARSFDRLATGPAVVRSAGSQLDADLRAMRVEERALPAADGPSPFAELVGRARRVLVASGS